MANEADSAKFTVQRNAVVATQAGTFISLLQATYPNKSIVQWRLTLTGSNLGTTRAGSSASYSGLIRWNGANFSNSYSRDGGNEISGSAVLAENTDFQIDLTVQGVISIRVRTTTVNPMMFTGKLEAEVATDTTNF